MRTLWTSSLALLLAASLVACDSGDDSESASDGYSTDSAGDGDGDGDGDGLACGEEWTEKDPMSGAEPLQPYKGFGAPCTSDADCGEIANGNGVCVTDILGLFEIPGGICTVLNCSPGEDPAFPYLIDSPECDESGGVDCIGIPGAFTACLPSCTSSDQCGREGYGCRLMPLIGAVDHPSYCLMDSEACCIPEDKTQCGA